MRDGEYSAEERFCWVLERSICEGQERERREQRKWESEKMRDSRLSVHEGGEIVVSIGESHFFRDESK